METPKKILRRYEDVIFLIRVATKGSVAGDRKFLGMIVD